MGISVVSSEKNSGTTTGKSVSLPSGGSVGDLLLVAITCNITGDPGISDNNGGTPLTKDATEQGLSGGNSVTFFSRKITGSEPSTLNFSGGGANRWAAIAFIVSGWDGTTVYDVSISGHTNYSATKTELTASGVNTNTDGSLAIAVATVDGASNGTFSDPCSPSGWTDVAVENGQQPLAISYKVIPSAGATGDCAVGCSLNTGFGSAVTVFAIKPSESTEETTSPLISMTQIAMEQVEMVQVALQSIMSYAVSQAQQASSFVFGTPIATGATSYTERSHGLSVPSIMSELSAPYPTNRWWTNLFMGSNRIAPHPYQVKPDSDGLQSCFPGMTISSSYILSNFIENWNIKSTDTITARKIKSYTDLGVKYRWTKTADTNYMEAYMVQGMAYITMLYTALTPKITTIHAITGVNGNSLPYTGTADKFKITLNNGQTWILYLDEAIEMTFENSGGYHAIATSPYTGALKMAILNDSAYETTLDTYRSAYPTGGSVDASISGNVATISFNWTKGGSGSLLMCSLPHHRDILQSVTPIDLGMDILFGDMKGIVGDTWNMQESLATITWNAPRSIDTDKVSAVQSALDSEESYSPGNPNDPYFGGKELSKSGRLALIADLLGDTTAASTLRTNLKSVLNNWLTEANSNTLSYDTTWKGLCAKNGMTDSGADFGSGYYNDHHFHWGYHIFAAACIAKEDASWLATYKDKVNEYVRDIMNPSESDGYSDKFRHFDWFAGHSWASGLFDFGDCANQESTSEAVNAWYACMLWGIAIGDNNIKEHARLLLATEIRAAQKYWQIDSGDGIYDATFAANKCVGVLWATKVEYATFFGANVEFIHEIQSIPFTPITELLLDPDWVTEEYSVVAAALTREDPVIEEGWKGFIYMKEGVIDKSQSWTDVNTLSSFDGGNSKTNTLYWVATRA